MKKNINREFLFTDNFNGPWYPGPLFGGEASVGVESGNLEKLVETLELHLGLKVKFPAMQERTIEALTGVRSYLEINTSAFFAESFKLDELSVSHHFVCQRDSLLMGGWNGDASVLPGRLGDAMNALAGCNSMKNLAGLPDRIIHINELLSGLKTRIFDTFYFIKDISRELELVQRLVSILESTGTKIARWRTVPISDDGVKTDLSLARHKVTKGGQFTPKGDGTLLLLQGDNAYDSAEAIASWLEREKPGGVVIIADDSGRPMLNAALQRHHLPAIGAESISPYRSALQILQLVFALQWKPLDPARLLEFLQLPLSPIPRRAGRELAGVVAEFPGIGSWKWNEAIDKLLKKADEPEKLRNRLSFWLPDEKTFLMPGSGMKTERIHAVCKNLSDWARTRSRAKKGQQGTPAIEDEMTTALLDAVCGQADRLSGLVNASGLAELGHLQLSRLLDWVSGEGLGIRVCSAEAGSVQSVYDPSALLGPADTVIWWNFTRAGGEYFPPKLFTDEERTTLAGNGIIIPGPGDLAMDISREWRRPFENAEKRLILMAGEVERGEPMAKHPVWDEVCAGWKDADKNAVTIHTRDLLTDGSKHFAVASKGVEPLPVPLPVAVFHLNNARPCLRDHESASSLESLAGCPLRYVLQYQAGLYGAEAVALLENSKVRGKVAHRIIQEVFGPGKKVAGKREAEELALLAVDKIASAEGATLMQPGLETEFGAFKRSIVNSASAFWRLINEHGLTVVGVERPIDAETEICGLDGYIDILLEDKIKKPLVLDMKYSDIGDRYYSMHLEKDEAVQLAVYSRSVGTGVPVAYLSLKDAQFITTAEDGFPGARPAGNSSIMKTWRRLVNTVKHVVKSQLKQKSVIATGVAEKLEMMPEDAFTEDGLRLGPPCRFCDYACLCGFAWAGSEGGA